jgi:hypothetical protein
VRPCEYSRTLRTTASQGAPPQRAGERDSFLELASIKVDLTGGDEGADDAGDEGLLPRLLTELSDSLTRVPWHRSDVVTNLMLGRH